MIHVVARSKEHADAFKKRHPALCAAIRIELGHTSYFDALNAIISRSNEPYVCIVHDDVTLNTSFGASVANLVQELDEHWPNWGLVGNAGVASFRVGYAGSNLVRYVSDPHGGPNLTGYVIPAQSVDGNVMLVNVSAVRRAKVSIPKGAGFHMYDLLLSISILSAGLAIFVAPQLACWHGSPGDPNGYLSASQLWWVRKSLSGSIRNRVIQTINGPIRVPPNVPNEVEATRVDLDLDSLRVAARGRSRKVTAIVVRTQLRRDPLLRRTLETVNAFIASAGDHTEFRCFVVTDFEKENHDLAVPIPPVLRVSVPEGSDSRYKLVQHAAQNIDADYYWFIDDDDWLFPNEAERLALVVNLAPSNSIIFVDAQCFRESTLRESEATPGFCTPARRFAASSFLQSLTGFNHTPFCGAVFSRSSLASLTSEACAKVTYYEDYMTLLLGLLGSRSVPIVVDRLYAAISIRESGNTVTETDRTKWNASMAELVSQLVSDPGLAQLLSLPSVGGEASGRSLAELQHIRTQLDQIKSSTSWRLTMPFRAMIQLLRREISFSSFFNTLGSSLRL